MIITINGCKVEGLVHGEMLFDSKVAGGIIPPYKRILPEGTGKLMKREDGSTYFKFDNGSTIEVEFVDD